MRISKADPEVLRIRSAKKRGKVKLEDFHGTGTVFNERKLK
jgi:hypothetical protein